MQKEISVVLGSYNRKAFLKLTIESIRKELSTFNLNGEIIVIDGGSIDGSVKWLLKQKDVLSIIQHNHGEWKGSEIENKSWGYFINLGFKCAQAKYICMISDDCLIVPGAIKNGLNLVEEKIQNNEKIGGVAYYWRDVPGPNKYWVGSLFDNTYLINHGIFVKFVLEELGYINEDDFKFYFADSDLCLRMNEIGYKILLSENSFIEHYSHANFKQRKKNSLNTEDDRKYFLNKWNGKILLSNPYFNKEKITVNYLDEYKTSNLFRKAQIVNPYLVKNKIKSIVKKLFKKHI